MNNSNDDVVDIVDDENNTIGDTLFESFHHVYVSDDTEKVCLNCKFDCNCDENSQINIKKFNLRGDVNVYLYKMISELSTVDPAEKKNIWHNKINSLSLLSIRSILKSFKRLKKIYSITNMNAMFLTILLKKWTGFIKKKESITLCLELHTYLQFNWSNIDPVVKSIFRKNIQRDIIKDTVHVKCQYSILKTLFLNAPTEETIYDFQPKSELSNSCKLYIQNVFFFPFVEVQIDLPDFSMVHRNCNHNEFKIINLSSIIDLEQLTKEKMFNLSSELYCSRTSDNENVERYSSTFTRFYLRAVKIYIQGKEQIFRPIADAVKAIIDEMIKDLSYIDSALEINQCFYKYISSYPYVRYLGNKREHSEAKKLPDLNIHLQQTTYPCIMFQVQKFSPCIFTLNEDDNFMFKPNTYNEDMFRDCLTYKCLLCKLPFKNDYHIAMHYLKNHGYEPPWICSKCSFIFTFEQLTLNGWRHDCQYA